jgi:hypothetical protein
LRDFTPTPQVHARQTRIRHPKFSVIDAHNHLGELMPGLRFSDHWPDRPVEELLGVMDECGVRVIVDLDGQTGDALERELDRYQRLIAKAGSYDQVLKGITERAAVINHAHRMTGDGLIWIVDEVIKMKDKLPRDELQRAMDTFIESQTLIPGRWRPIAPEDLEGNTLKARLLRAIQADLEECKETV